MRKSPWQTVSTKKLQSQFRESSSGLLTQLHWIEAKHHYTADRQFHEEQGAVEQQCAGCNAHYFMSIASLCLAPPGGGMLHKTSPSHSHTAKQGCALLQCVCCGKGIKKKTKLTVTREFSNLWQKTSYVRQCHGCNLKKSTCQNNTHVRLGNFYSQENFTQYTQVSNK